jgi:hypothetical protein
LIHLCQPINPHFSFFHLHINAPQSQNIARTVVDMESEDKDWLPPRRRGSRRRRHAASPTQKTQKTKTQKTPMQKPVAADVTPTQTPAQSVPRQIVPRPPIAKPLQALSVEETRAREQAVCLLTRPSSTTPCLSYHNFFFFSFSFSFSFFFFFFFLLK